MKMFLLTVLSTALLVSAEGPSKPTAIVSATFEGTSTLHDFQGHAESSPAPATWTPADQGGLLDIPDIVFGTRSLSTDHEKRDRNMMKMFEPDTHPAIIGHVRGWNLVPGQASDQRLTLDIHGTRIEVPVRVTTVEDTPEGLHLVCDFSLSLQNCTLKRPSVLGLIRVGDEVKLHVETRIPCP